MFATQIPSSGQTGAVNRNNGSLGPVAEPRQSVTLPPIRTMEPDPSRMSPLVSITKQTISSSYAHPPHSILSPSYPGNSNKEAFVGQSYYTGTKGTGGSSANKSGPLSVTRDGNMTHYISTGQNNTSRSESSTQARAFATSSQCTSHASPSSIPNLQPGNAHIDHVNSTTLSTSLKNQPEPTLPMQSVELKECVPAVASTTTPPNGTPPDQTPLKDLDEDFEMFVDMMTTRKVIKRMEIRTDVPDLEELLPELVKKKRLDGKDRKVFEVLFQRTHRLPLASQTEHLAQVNNPDNSGWRRLSFVCMLHGLRMLRSSEFVKLLWLSIVFDKKKCEDFLVPGRFCEELQKYCKDGSGFSVSSLYTPDPHFGLQDAMIVDSDDEESKKKLPLHKDGHVPLTKEQELEFFDEILDELTYGVFGKAYCIFVAGRNGYPEREWTRNEVKKNLSKRVKTFLGVGLKPSGVKRQVIQTTKPASEWFLRRLSDKADVTFPGTEEASFFRIYCGLELDFGDPNGVMEETNGLGMLSFVNTLYCRSLVFAKTSEYENKKDKDVKQPNAPPRSQEIRGDNSAPENRRDSVPLLKHRAFSNFTIQSSTVKHKSSDPRSDDTRGKIKFGNGSNGRSALKKVREYDRDEEEEERRIRKQDKRDFGGDGKFSGGIDKCRTLSSKKRGERIYEDDDEDDDEEDEDDDYSDLDGFVVSEGEDLSFDSDCSPGFDIDDIDSDYEEDTESSGSSDCSSEDLDSDEEFRRWKKKRAMKKKKIEEERRREKRKEEKTRRRKERERRLKEEEERERKERKERQRREKERDARRRSKSESRHAKSEKGRKESPIKNKVKKEEDNNKIEKYSSGEENTSGEVDLDLKHPLLSGLRRDLVYEFGNLMGHKEKSKKTKDGKAKYVLNKDPITISPKQLERVCAIVAASVAEKLETELSDRIDSRIEEVLENMNAEDQDDSSDEDSSESESEESEEDEVEKKPRKKKGKKPDVNSESCEGDSSSSPETDDEKSGSNKKPDGTESRKRKRSVISEESDDDDDDNQHDSRESTRDESGKERGKASDEGYDRKTKRKKRRRDDSEDQLSERKKKKNKGKHRE